MFLDNPYSFSSLDKKLKECLGHLGRDYFLAEKSGLAQSISGLGNPILHSQFRNERKGKG